VDLQALVSTSEFELVTATHPTQRSGVVKSILISIARPGDGIANGGISGYLDGRRTYSDVQARFVLESEFSGGGRIDVLSKEEFISQVREAEDANDIGRESVSLLGNEILRPLILPHRKARHARSRRWDGIELRSVNDGVAEVQNVGGCQIVVDLHSSLVRVLAHDLRR